MKNPFGIVKDFEDALCEYTGAPYCVAVNSCTNALFLSIRARKKDTDLYTYWATDINIPKRTYVSVPMQIMHAGYTVSFRDEEWLGMYQLRPFPVWDSARWLYRNMYEEVSLTTKMRTKFPDYYQTPVVCLSFHWSKTLGIQQGGAILHNNSRLDEWLRRARFDGRTEGVPPIDDKFVQPGWHMYMSPEVAAEGLVRIRLLKDMNEPLPNDDYPDLSKIEIFK